MNTYRFYFANNEEPVVFRNGELVQGEFFRRYNEENIFSVLEKHFTIISEEKGGGSGSYPGYVAQHYESKFWENKVGTLTAEGEEIVHLCELIYKARKRGQTELVMGLYYTLGEKYGFKLEMCKRVRISISEVPGYTMVRKAEKMSLEELNSQLILLKDFSTKFTHGDVLSGRTQYPFDFSVLFFRLGMAIERKEPFYQEGFDPRYDGSYHRGNAHELVEWGRRFIRGELEEY